MSEQSPATPEIVQYPLLPLRDVVVFPHMVIPLFVGRPKSIKAMETAMEAGKSILLVAQKSAAKDDPGPQDMYSIGCVSNILQMLKLPDGTVKVLVEGGRRRRGRRRRCRARGRGAAARAALGVRPVRQAEQEDPARDSDFALRDRR